MKKPTGAARGSPRARPDRVPARRFSRLRWLPLLGLCLSCPAAPAELDAFAGGRVSDQTGQKTYTWGIEYREPLSTHWSGSFIWLNEGHVPNNHRDGQAVQVWWHTVPGPKGVSFEAGLGPYLDYDTHLTPSDSNTEDRHGWGALASADLRWDFARNWSTYLRFNEVDTSAKHASTGIAAGVAYVFPQNFATLAAQRAVADSVRHWEADALFGVRIVNSFQSESGGAEALDLRFRFSRHVVASATLVTGQDTSLNWSDGLALQLWLEQALGEHLRAAVGAGAFIVAGDSSLRSDSSPKNLSSALSVTLAYVFTPRWLGRLTWTRLGTGDDHDCDLLLAGAGYQL